MFCPCSEMAAHWSSVHVLPGGLAGRVVGSIAT
jgi:hypothetical protein